MLSPPHGISSHPADGLEVGELGDQIENPLPRRDSLASDD